MRMRGFQLQTSLSAYCVNQLRFVIISSKIGNHPIIYLDETKYDQQLCDHASNCAH